MITIVDYGMGNLGSIKNMFKRIGVQANITGDVAQITLADKLVLPGVGAFDHAMKKINSSGLREILDHKALVEKVPILGICLGMQLLTNSSEEGHLPGLGWIQAETIRFPISDTLKVPHMGWNEVCYGEKSPLTEGFPAEVRFYFVHSYYVRVKDKRNSILSTTYGLTFSSAIQNDNIYGVQFHPEKSHRFGMNLLANFARV